MWLVWASRAEDFGEPACFSSTPYPFYCTPDNLGALYSRRENDVLEAAQVSGRDCGVAGEGLMQSAHYRVPKLVDGGIPCGKTFVLGHLNVACTGCTNSLPSPLPSKKNFSQPTHRLSGKGLVQHVLVQLIHHYHVLVILMDNLWLQSWWRRMKPGYKYVCV